MEKLEISLNSPFCKEDVKYLKDIVKSNDIYVYCGKDYYMIIYFGQRKYKYGKNAIKSVISKINYTIKNNI
jgi:hypothetical protein